LVLLFHYVPNLIISLEIKKIYVGLVGRLRTNHCTGLK
jgi:hypothetical protein